MLNLFIIHNIKSLRQLKCFVIFYLQTIFHKQFINIFIMLLRLMYHIPRHKQCQILWLMFLYSLITQYLNSQKIKFVTAQQRNVTKRHLCHPLLCHATTNFILLYVTANMCWSIKQYILSAMTVHIFALIIHHEKCILTSQFNLLRSSKY